MMMYNATIKDGQQVRNSETDLGSNVNEEITLIWPSGGKNENNWVKYVKYFKGEVRAPLGKPIKT